MIVASISYAYLRFYLQLNTPIYPGFPDALIRGSFGNTLKKIVCVNRESECTSCLLRQSCAFGMFFYPTLDREIEFRHINTPPPPYSFVVYPPGPKQELIVDLLLFPPGFSYIPYIVYAFLTMGKKGIGKAKITFRLQRITDLANMQSVYVEDDENIGSPDPITLNPIYESDKWEGIQRLRIEFTSPLRLKTKNGFISNPDFLDIVKASLIRLSLLVYVYGTGSLRKEAKSLLEKAEGIKRGITDIRWQKRRRYSSNQKRTLAMGGMNGWIEYHGDFQPFHSLLDSASLLGIGKSTTFGFGRFKVDAFLS